MADNRNPKEMIFSNLSAHPESELQRPLGRWGYMWEIRLKKLVRGSFPFDLETSYRELWGKNLGQSLVKRNPWTPEGRRV